MRLSSRGFNRRTAARRVPPAGSASPRSSRHASPDYIQHYNTAPKPYIRTANLEEDRPRHQQGVRGFLNHGTSQHYEQEEPSRLPGRGLCFGAYGLQAITGGSSATSSSSATGPPFTRSMHQKRNSPSCSRTYSSSDPMFDPKLTAGLVPAHPPLPKRVAVPRWPSQFSLQHLPGHAQSGILVS